jgi:hypothetical protein
VAQNYAQSFVRNLGVGSFPAVAIPLSSMMRRGHGLPSVRMGSPLRVAMIAVLVVASTLLVLPLKEAVQDLPSAPMASLRADGSPAETSNWTGYNSTPCGVLAAEYGSGSGISYYANYTIIFAKICQTQQFVTIYDEGFGAEGVFGIGMGGRIGAVPNLSFSLYRSGECTNASLGSQCVFQADWIGYLSNNSFSGPYLREYPAIYMGGPILAPNSSPAGPFPSLLAVAGGVAVGAVIGLALVTSRRRSDLRDAVLRDENEPESPPQRSPPSGKPPEEPNNTLDDIF